MFHEDGRAYDGDPRHALARVADRYKAKGLTPVVAVELEFFLIDDSTPPQPANAPRQPPQIWQTAQGGGNLVDPGVDAFDSFFTELYDACEAMEIPPPTPPFPRPGWGQFEINLMHVPPDRCVRR